MTDTPAHLYRVLADSADPESWHRLRGFTMTASKMKSLAKIDRLEHYATKMLEPDGAWGGNDYTRSGHEWEAKALEDNGIAPNSLLIHAPGELRIAATVDGIDLEAGELAEVKTRHGRHATGPTPAERRQIRGQQFCLPEFRATRFIEVVLDPKGKLVDYVHEVIPYDELVVGLFITQFVYPTLEIVERIREERAAA